MRVCLVCKVPLRFEALCAVCMGGLLRLREPVVRRERGYRVCLLYSWREKSPKALPWMIRSLKHHDSPMPWRELASWMLEVFGPLENAVFVPVPSKKRNHALGLCRALSHLTGFPVVAALGVGSERSQKLLDRADRQEIRFEREIWSFCTEYTNVVIVDDVVTTGATALAAFQTLGRPRNSEVWCLMDRRPCGA